MSGQGAGPGLAAVAAVLIAVLVAVLGWAAWSLPEETPGLAPAAAAALDRSGVTNPVTAVLLNYRAYDTLLEIAVLFLAVLGGQVLVGGQPPELRDVDLSQNRVLAGFVRILTPAIVLVSGYLLWVGGHAPGGAFQAGAVLASAGVLLYLSGSAWSRNLPGWGERWLLAAGLAGFLLIGAGVMAGGASFLEYPAGAAKWLILLIEAACTLSIAAALLALFLGGRLRVSPATALRERTG